MTRMRQHGELVEEDSIQFPQPVEGKCISSVIGPPVTVTFTIPSYDPDRVWGPAPYIPAWIDSHGDSLIPLPVAGMRLLIVFSSEGRPWVIGATTQA